MNTDKKNQERNEVIKEVQSNGDTEKNLTSVWSPQSRKEVNIDLNESMEYAVNGEKIEIDAATNTRILRKMDICLLPIMCCLYCFQFIDKTVNSMASIMGMREDLKMTGNKYPWTGTAFYIGYLVFEFPVSALL
ncbi:unnamed protein product [Debaryomyces tyrocola]|nr:unnamed protein product [Debaryomyces tyrocola]